MLNANLHATRNGELVSMNLSTQAILSTHLHDFCGLLHSEEATVAEYIDKVGKVLLSHSRNHVTAHVVYILCLTTLVGTTNGVCTEERSTHLDRGVLTNTLDDTQYLKLVLER